MNGNLTVNLEKKSEMDLTSEFFFNVKTDSRNTSFFHLLDVSSTGKGNTNNRKLYQSIA